MRRYLIIKNNGECKHYKDSKEKYLFKFYDTFEGAYMYSTVSIKSIINWIRYKIEIFQYKRKKA